MKREDAIEVARACAKAKPASYYAEPFEPHPWVVDAIELVGADLEQVAAERDQLRAELAQVRNELIAAIPTEDERQVLRFIREAIIRDVPDRVRGSLRYIAALELLQRLLTLKVNHGV